MIAYLIGGGPSAANVDLGKIEGGITIGINDAAFHKPCDAFFSNDHGYCLGIREKIEAFAGDRHLAIRPRFMDRFAGWDTRVWTRVDEASPCTRPGHLSSGPQGTAGCSGYVALNLAAQMGADVIVLFGYDFGQDYRYFFSDAPYPRVRIQEVIQSFRDVAPWYRRRGISIYNANPASAIDAFERVTHEEALNIR